MNTDTDTDTTTRCSTYTWCTIDHALEGGHHAGEPIELAVPEAGSPSPYVAFVMQDESDAEPMVRIAHDEDVDRWELVLAPRDLDRLLDALDDDGARAMQALGGLVAQVART